MKTTVTTLCLVGLMIGLVSTSTAQPVRNGVDVIWARDVDGAEMTLDGVLDEAVWQQAEMIELVWDGTHPEPGGGQRIDGSYTPENPPDPNNGKIYILRDGNTLWLGAEVQDKSVGGHSGFFNSDGLIMNILDRTRLTDDRFDDSQNPVPNFFQGNRTEFFITWRIVADTTDSDDTYDDGTVIGSGFPLPGIGPRLHGFYGMDGDSSVTAPRDPAMQAIWDVVTVVDGITNDDTHGDDVGYVIEMRLDMAAIGYDFEQEGGDKAAWNVALQDRDNAWPVDPDTEFRSRVWWQNQWGNNFNEGAAYIYGAPGVTVNSDAPDVVEPEFTIGNGELFDAPVIDGSLDDDVWSRVEPSFFVQYQADEALRNQNPEIARYYMFYFRPDINGDGNAALVVDPSIAEFKMFYRDQTLYVGVDVADQAISGTSAENGLDGIYFFLRSRDSLTTAGSLATLRFDFSVDSSGAVRYGSDALAFSQEDPSSVQAAVSLKGTSTAADPSDIDEGYQIEFAIHLPTVLGYPEDLGDRMLWTAMTFLDGDFLESASDSYAMRTWIITERGGNGSSIYGYLDAANVIGTAAEDVAELPTSIRLDGNYPNPFNPSTTISYAIPYSGKVQIRVFDAIGRVVQTLDAGAQPAGRHEFAFQAGDLASGVYFYRVDLVDALGSELVSGIGRMILVK